jgi:DNA-binding NarL/FixJ family response regulator
MSTDPIYVYVAKSSGRLCEGLCSLLENQPAVKLLGVLQDETTLIQNINSAASSVVVLLDMDLFGENIFAFCQSLILKAPHSGTILLVDTHKQKQKAFASGANEALIKGYTANELITAIQQVHYSLLTSDPMEQGKH